MEKKKVEVNTPLAVSGITIVPITETTTYALQTNGAFNCFGLKRPLYILVMSPGATARAFQITGEEITIDQIILKYPELQQALDRLRDF